MLQKEANEQLIKKLNFDYDAKQFISDARENEYCNFKIRSFAQQKIMKVYNKLTFITYI